MTPYLIIDSEMIRALLMPAKRGIDVRIILPHIPDKKLYLCLQELIIKILLKWC